LQDLTRIQRLTLGRLILLETDYDTIARQLRISREQARRAYETYYLGYGERPYGPIGHCAGCGCRVVLPCKYCYDSALIARKRMFRDDVPRRPNH
jgi:hypothetical protein